MTFEEAFLAAAELLDQRGQLLDAPTFFDWLVEIRIFW